MMHQHAIIVGRAAPALRGFGMLAIIIERDDMALPIG